MASRIVTVPNAAPPLGPYSMGIATEGAGTWLHIAGQVGVAPDGSLADGFEAQARQAWSNLASVLASADMKMEHLVKVNAYLTKLSDVPLFGPIRTSFIGEARPASTLVVVQALARPEWLIEVEGVAFRPSTQ
ncbi:RidA family protein [Pigmentiphaga sp.]|uniref:RidA family protein n=1 Tax=Pigmentiphaga sp. TaxID=1977564 RepID=UPI0025EEF212|nr:RidA family protein [Pigmentiphaga sp.]MBX6320108.1 RidA family protein [Pigmentiphaga sp.]